MTTPTPLRDRPKLTLSPKRLEQAVRSDPDTPSGNDDPRDRRRTQAFRLFVVVAFIGVAALALFTRTVASNETDLQTLLRSLELTCAQDDGAEVRRLCLLTEQVRQDNAAAIATAEGLNTDQIIALVRAEIAANPPRDGQNVSTDVVADVVRQVLAANPELYRGEPGALPTSEQVLMAVAAVIAADPDAFRGRDGDTGAAGPQGVGLGDLRFERREGECLAVVLLEDPATGTTREITRPVADGVCEDAPTPTEPDPGTNPPTAPPPTVDPAPSTDPAPPAPDPEPPLFG